MKSKLMIGLWRYVGPGNPRNVRFYPNGPGWYRACQSAWVCWPVRRDETDKLVENGELIPEEG